MNKYCWFIIITTLLFIGCRDNFSRSFEFKINNDTSNDIYVQMTGFTYPPYLRDTFCGVISPNDTLYRVIRIENLNRNMWENYTFDNITLYNRSDTTYISGSFGGGYLSNSSSVGNIKSEEYYDGEYDGTIRRALTITDSLLSFFTKDYTMLEKFKDYYSSPN